MTIRQDIHLLHICCVFVAFCIPRNLLQPQNYIPGTNAYRRGPGKSLDVSCIAPQWNPRSCWRSISAGVQIIMVKHVLQIITFPPIMSILYNNSGQFFLSQPVVFLETNQIQAPSVPPTQSLDCTLYQAHTLLTWLTSSDHHRDKVLSWFPTFSHISCGSIYGIIWHIFSDILFWHLIWYSLWHGHCPTSTASSSASLSWRAKRKEWSDPDKSWDP